MELIVAFAENGVIGNRGMIPWHIPEDLMRFKHITLNNIIIMGRKTFESFPNGPLKDRIHIVLTRGKEKTIGQNIFFVNQENLLNILKSLEKSRKIFVIGGKEIYDLLFDFCNTFHITLIENEPDGDVFFSYSLQYFMDNFHLSKISDTQISSKNKIKYTYYTFQRK